MKLESDLLLNLPNIAHGFFTRQGGVSGGLYASLNCGPGSGDARENVIENRRRVAAQFSRNLEDLLTLYQVHGSDVVTVKEHLEIGAQPTADGMVTDQPGIILGVLAADCAPILFADPKKRIIGAAHSGWRSAKAGIIESTVAAMEKLGATREDILAAVGPCIGKLSYEVGEDFIAPFLSEDKASSAFFDSVTGGKSHFDLKGYIAKKLAEAGISLINLLANDTFVEEDRFFSYRRTTLRKEPDYGRQVSAIMIEE